MDKAMHSEFEGHTPGPWRAAVQSNEVILIKANSIEVGRANPHFIESKVNGALLAAAPDLLKENQSLRSELQKQKYDNENAWKGVKEVCAQKYELQVKFEELQSQLSKQKELNAELVKITEELIKLPPGTYFEIGSHGRQKIESLIKKYKES